MHLAGLLACFLFTAFPSCHLADSGLSINSFCFPHAAGQIETYSYGDSAGITPDFPFNPAMREPDAANVMECLKRKKNLFFNRFIIVDRKTQKIIGCSRGIIISSGSCINIIAQTVFRTEGIIDTCKNSQV